MRNSYSKFLENHFFNLSIAAGVENGRVIIAFRVGHAPENGLENFAFHSLNATEISTSPPLSVETQNFDP